MIPLPTRAMYDALEVAASLTLPPSGVNPHVVFCPECNRLTYGRGFALALTMGGSTGRFCNRWCLMKWLSPRPLPVDALVAVLPEPGSVWPKQDRELWLTAMEGALRWAYGLTPPTSSTRP